MTVTQILSARGSRILPHSVTSFRHRAMSPSSLSVSAPRRRIPVAQERSWILGLCLAAVLAFCSQRAWRSKHRVAAGLCGILLLMQGFGTLALSLRRAQEWMIFAGDAGCMVLGTLMMSTVYVRRGHILARGWLRWGFLVIGAAALLGGPLAMSTYLLAIDFSGASYAVAVSAVTLFSSPWRSPSSSSPSRAVCCW